MPMAKTALSGLSQAESRLVERSGHPSTQTISTGLRSVSRLSEVRRRVNADEARRFLPERSPAEPERQASRRQANRAAPEARPADQVCLEVQARPGRILSKPLCRGRYRSVFFCLPSQSRKPSFRAGGSDMMHSHSVIISSSNCMSVGCLAGRVFIAFFHSAKRSRSRPRKVSAPRRRE